MKQERDTVSKRSVIQAAIQLFNTKGFNGTSVRDIAGKAEVNVALISYYFNGKKGLAEFLMTSFLEGYVKEIEAAYQQLDMKSAKTCLIDAIQRVMEYQHQNRQLARFVHREITFDSVLVREIMTTYLSKEKFYFSKIYEVGFARKEFRPQSIDYIIMQMKGMLSMPFLHPQYILEVHHIQPHEHYFIDRYTKQLKEWIELYICETESWGVRPLVMNG
ncbi:forespore capture DNA-binding protein RefZ [Guptibacillus hwajinpoensis]|uniref:AcrR family transcriptional regulator n=1 Tax=Guptibacillus hwajinpoensis TaxID=208199 RepID=A0ABU0JXT3_9BACL|nr:MULTISPECIES: forespore capture DNA-binding protein RefZ [Alkalihalobacillus]MDP4550948.1 forespore capture DNA-binding protein RefZ [Alkalihalobacillus macyae]MDQ0481270.1 AcrR family transcriptional regulator [Alkalihalobacillus hemicentroti]